MRRIRAILSTVILCCSSCGADHGPAGYPVDPEADATETGVDVGWLTDLEGEPDVSIDPASDPIQPDLGDGPVQPDLETDGSDGPDVDWQDLSEPEMVQPPCPSSEELAEPAVRGTVYRDTDESSDSYYAQSIDPQVDEPLGSIDIALISPEEERWTTTCPSGEFSFGAVADGAHLLDVQLDDGSVCTSTNSPGRFPEAVREGQVTIVTFGDSIPCYSPTPTFPTRVATLVSPLAEVEEVNVAVGGSMATDWLPGTPLFENTLRPHLEQADVVVISLGGNDLQTYFTEADLTDPQAVLQMAAQFPAYQREIEANLVVIIEEIQVSAPEVDVVYVMYPNYAHSTVWAEYAGEWIDLVVSGVDRALNELRENMSAIDGIILADLYGATADYDLDLFLMDGIHLSEAGTVFWAREVFLALGGVLVDEEPLGLQRMFGFGPD